MEQPPAQPTRDRVALRAAPVTVALTALIGVGGVAQIDEGVLLRLAGRFGDMA